MKSVGQLLGWSFTYAVILGLIYNWAVNPRNGAFKRDNAEVIIILTFAVFIFGVLFAYALSMVVGEWKDCQRAVFKKDLRTLLVEAPVRLPTTMVRLLWIIGSAILLLSWGLHMSSPPLAYLVGFMTPFLLINGMFILIDLDDPFSGVVNVPGITKAQEQLVYRVNSILRDHPDRVGDVIEGILKEAESDAPGGE